jgi:microsomal prostaglandin-E synthase 1
MDDLTTNPAFTVYAVASVVLCSNLLALWGYSGAVRAKSKTAINEEDAARQSAQILERDPPDVARVLRAHANAQASIYPFLFLGLLFVLGGGSARTAAVIFGIFTVARLAHSVVYLAGKQPWRTVLFLVGLFATAALTVAVIYLIAKGL